MITSVKGNKLEIVVPLRLVEWQGDDRTERDFEPTASDEVKAWLRGNHSFEYAPRIEANCLMFTDNGELWAGVYDLEVRVTREYGSRLRAYHRDVLNIATATDEAITDADAALLTASGAELSAAVFEIMKGKDGLSAYELAVKNGYVGTETEWLLSLKGGGYMFTPYRLAVEVKNQQLTLTGDVAELLRDGFYPFLFRFSRQKFHRYDTERKRWRKGSTRCGWNKIGDETTVNVSDKGVVSIVCAMQKWRDEDNNNFIDDEYFAKEHIHGSISEWRKTGDNEYYTSPKDWLPRVVVEEDDDETRRHYADFADFHFVANGGEPTVGAYVPMGVRRRRYFAHVYTESPDFTGNAMRNKAVTLCFGIGFARRCEDVTLGNLVTPLAVFKVCNIWDYKSDPDGAICKWGYRT